MGRLELFTRNHIFDGHVLWILVLIYAVISNHMESNEISKEDLQTGFVDPFDEASSRGRLYQGYLKYNEDLQTLLRGQRYLQWIDGSFISTQINPGDIDLVSLIDYQLIEKYESELKRFLNR